MYSRVWLHNKSFFFVLAGKKAKRLVSSLITEQQQVDILLFAALNAAEICAEKINFSLIGEFRGCFSTRMHENCFNCCNYTGPQVASVPLSGYTFQTS